MVPWLVVVLAVCVRVSLRRFECRSASSVVVGVESLLFVRIWGQVLSPPTAGLVSVNIMSGCLCSSTTLRAVVSDLSLCVTPVCDFTLPICVLYPMMSLMCMMLSTSCRRCLCGWCVKLSGSMVYLRMVLILSALSVRIERVWSSLLVSSAKVMAANSAQSMVCLSG